MILGANGMLGSSILRYFSKRDKYDVIGTVRSQIACESLKKIGFKNVLENIDINNDSLLISMFKDFKPDYVFNCIGIIKQQNQAQETLPVIKINSLLPHRIAKLCKDNNSKLIHFSTDCVFSGKKGMYVESDIPDANDLYGRSKFLGEVNYDNHLTLRTSIIGHELKSSLSLVDWFLSRNHKINGYSSAIFSGMPTIYLAKFLDEFVIPNHEISGTYHLSVDPIDKFSLLTLIKKVYSSSIPIDKCQNIKIDRSLNSDKLRKAVGFQPPGWPYLIEKMNNEYKQYFN